MANITYKISKTDIETDISFYSNSGSFEANADAMKKTAKWFKDRKIKPINHLGLAEIIYYGGFVTILFRDEGLASGFLKTFIKAKNNTHKHVDSHFVHS